MTLNQSALLELTDVLRTADGGQVMRLMLSAMLQALVDAEATAHIGANPYEHQAGLIRGLRQTPCRARVGEDVMDEDEARLICAGRLLQGRQRGWPQR